MAAPTTRVPDYLRMLADKYDRFAWNAEGSFMSGTFRTIAIVLREEAEEYDETP